MKRTRSLSRRTRLVSASPMKKVNRKRRQSEFARCYGSKARVALFPSGETWQRESGAIGSLLAALSAVPAGGAK